ncbi:MAG: hypothetical protein WBA16_04230 [Nonlabens sp.]
MKFVFYILLICFLTSCKNEKPEEAVQEKEDLQFIKEPEVIKNDSLTIRVFLPAGESILLNMNDHVLNHFTIDIRNTTDRDSVYTRTIENLNPHQIIEYAHVDASVPGVFNLKKPVFW